MKKRERKLNNWHKTQVKELEWVAGTLARRISNKKHLGNATEYDDLKQVAFWGICAAVYDWNPNGGKAISSYAWDRAFAYIGHYMRDRSRIIKIPRDVQKLYYNYCELKKDPNIKLHHILTKLECTKSELEEAIKVGVSTPFQLFSETLTPVIDFENKKDLSDTMLNALNYVAYALNDAQMELCMKYLRGEVKKQSDKDRVQEIMYNLRDKLESMGFTADNLNE